MMQNTGKATYAIIFNGLLGYLLDIPAWEQISMTLLSFWMMIGIEIAARQATREESQ